jgi:hypothetical protein
VAYKAILGDPVSGQDVTAYLEWGNWQVSATYGQRGKTGKFILAEDVASNPTAWKVVVLPMTRFTVTDTTLGAVIFAGVVTDPFLRKEGALLNHWELSCRDYTVYADNVIIHGDYTNATADVIIKDLTSRANCGITTNNVKPGPQIARVVINYLTLSEAWNRVNAYASQGALWGWLVDENLDLNTFDGLKQIPLAAPSFTDVQTSVNGTSVFPYVWDNFSYEWAGDSVRNRIKVRGGSYTGPASDNFVGNGTQFVWPLTFPVNSGNPNLKVTVAGAMVGASIDPGNDPSTPVPAGTCLMTQLPSGAWFARFGTIPTNGQAVVMSYTFLMPVLSQVDDQPSEQAYSLQPNSLSNGGFETVDPTDTSIGLGWKHNNVGTGTANLFNNNANSGNNAITFTNPSTGNYGGIFSKQGIPVTGGQKFTLSAYVKGNVAGTTGPFRVVIANPGANISAGGVASAQPSAQSGVVVFDINLSVTTTYQQFSQTVTIPSGYSWLFIECYSAGNGTPSTVYYDDIAAQVASPNRGIFEMYLSDPTITNVLTAKSRGQREISEYGVAEERVIFSTMESNAYHLHVGDVISWTSSLVPDYTKPLNPIGLTGLFLIVQLQILGTPGPYRRYAITAVRVG